MSTLSFSYSARDKYGARRKGVVRAQTHAEAYRRVAADGLVPIRLRLARSGDAAFQRARVSAEELAQFTHELSVLLEAGIIISDGLRSIAEQMRNERFRRVALDVASKIQAGSSISESLACHPRVFGEVYIETVRAAERSGNMINILNALAEMLEQQNDFRRSVKRALSYPIIVLATLSLAVAFLLAFVVPRFADMFTKRGMDLPLLTQALQSVGVSLRDWWWVYILAGFTLVWGVRRAWAVPQGRWVIDRLLHRIPHLRRVLVGGAVARFSRVFGLCIGSGLPLIDSLELSARASGRPMLAADARRLIDSVRRGERLTDALTSCHYLPSFAKRMLAAGEESAQLARMCRIIAKHHERETSHLAGTLATVIEPVLIVALTGVVLIVALAIFIPMWDMAGLVG